MKGVLSPKPLTARMQQARRRKMIAEYLAPDSSAREVAARFGISRNALSVNMHRWGVRLPDDELTRRLKEGGRKGGARGGPALVWPDCPEHLREDYETLRRYMSARKARETLEGQSQ